MAMSSKNDTPTRGVLSWSHTTIMNVQDLSRDDDFLSHLLVEKLGTGSVPLHVHKMDPSRRLPKTDASDLLQIVRRLVVSKGSVAQATKQSVDELLMLPPVRYYLRSYTQKQINAFATHAARYFELYHPSGSIEISHTSRYAHRTGKSELCILATKHLAPNDKIPELKGSMANLTDEEDRELKRTGLRTSHVRRDFSVIHSKQMKKNHLFLGPARFVNHDCDNNCELVRSGRLITFKVIRPIAIGEEITAHYGDGYFGKKNRHCLCETCERKGRGGYAPDHSDDEVSSSDSSDDSESDTSTDSDAQEDDNTQEVNLDERRTRRGVYAVTRKEEEGLSDESEDDNDDDNIVPLANAEDVPADGEIELSADADPGSSTLFSGRTQRSRSGVSTTASSLTPISRSSSSLSSLSPAPAPSPTTSKGRQASFKSIISTRRQKASQESANANHPLSRKHQLVTPPLSDGTGSVGESSSTPNKRTTRSVSALVTPVRRGRPPKKKRPSYMHAPSPLTPAARKMDKGKGKEEIKVKTEEVEPRLVKGKPVTSAQASETATPTKPVPTGPDGKPLPTCANCANILPLISVDSKVVWGLGLESQSKKKREKLECPRCMRHYAIYGQAWPRRVPLHGSTFLPTPREDTPGDLSASSRVTHKALPVLDRKLVAAASAPSRSLFQKDDTSERPTKRRKTEIISVSMSDSAKRQLAKGGLLRRSASPEVPPKRKRGRPRLSDLARRSRAENDPKPFKDQPRTGTGQFDKKLDSPAPSSPSKPLVHAKPTPMQPKSRAERAMERDKHKALVEKEKYDSASLKRKSEAGLDGVDSRASKKPKNSNDKRPLQKVMPRPHDFHSGILFTPSPLNFAIRAWRRPVIPDDEASTDEERGPVTPPDVSLSPPVVVTDISDEDPIAESIVSTSFIPTLLKPSPINLAKRRWSSMSTSPAGTDIDTPSLPDISSSAQSHPSSVASHIPSLEERPASYESQYYSSTFSDDEEGPTESLKLLYPVVCISAAPSDNLSIHKSFSSHGPTSPPRFIDAGWDSASDISAEL